MATYKTQGIVLRRHDLGEADRIITFLTPDYGQLKAVARGIRRIKSRLAGHLELFSETELMLAEGKNLDVVASARLLRHHNNLSQDYSALTYAYLFAEMLDKLLEEGLPSIAAYRITSEAYQQLDAGYADAITELGFRLKLLDVLGYCPELVNCAVCGQRLDGGLWINPERGGIVDRSCKTALDTPMDANHVKLWRLLLTAAADKVRRVGGAESAAQASLASCNKFYDYTFGRQFKSAQLLGYELRRQS
jgi:DNA repair protein RecO (recombination protein O)